MAGSSRVIGGAVIILILFIIHAAVLAQPTSDRSPEANIRAISSTNKFASEIAPGRYDADTGYYFIGSTNRAIQNNTISGTSNKTSSLENNSTEYDRMKSNSTSEISIGVSGPTYDPLTIDETISNALFITINTKEKQVESGSGSDSQPIKKRERDGTGELEVGTSNGGSQSSEYSETNPIRKGNPGQ